MRGGLLFIAPLLALACNALTGIGDLVATDDGGVIDLPEAGRLEEAADGGADSAAVEIPAPPPTCACAPAPPAGWSALSLLLTTTGATPSGCPTGLFPTMKAGSDPKGGGCSPCTCGTVTGACTRAIVQTAKDNCANPCSAIAPVAVTSTCTPITYCNASSAASAYMAPDAGSCAPSGGTFSAATVFEKNATACGFSVPPAGSCSAGEVCAPKSEGAPNAPICIVKAGDNDCPVGVYATKTVYYGAVDDRRTCAACSCSAPNVTCSPATVALYIGNECNNLQDEVSTVANACATFGVPLPPGSAKITAPSNVMNNTGCAPSGGTAQGTLTGKDPMTVCCMN